MDNIGNHTFSYKKFAMLHDLNLRMTAFCFLIESKSNLVNGSSGGDAVTTQLTNQEPDLLGGVGGSPVKTSPLDSQMPSTGQVCSQMQEKNGP